MVEVPKYAAPLGRLPSGLFIITAGAGESATGMLASWVQQSSFEPPQVSLAVRPGRYCSDLLTVGADFAVNIIAAGQTQFLIHFGRGFGPGEPAFEGLFIHRLPTGTTILNDALGYLQARVVARYPGGDHDIVVGQVIDGKMQNEGTPYVHIRKSGLNY